MPHERNTDEVGSLWQKKSDKGVYMTGTILGQKVVIFANRNKRPGSNQPDWRVLKSKPLNNDAPADSGQPVAEDEIPF